MKNPRYRMIYPTIFVLGLLGFMLLFSHHTYAEIPVSQGKSVVASTVSSVTYSAEKAVDGLIYTKWSAGSISLPQSLTVDLGQNITILRTETIFDDAGSSYQYRIDSSLDGINWTPFVDKTSNAAVSFPRYIDYGNIMARYMRITVTGVGTPGNLVVINQFDVYQSAAPLYLLSQGKTAVASSVFSNSWDAGKAVDGLISTSWAPSSNNLPQWLIVDLGQNLNVLQVETTYSNKNEVYKYKIEFSVDGINWYPFSDQSTNTKISNPRYVDLGNVTARYFRISTIGIGTVGAFPSIAEFNLYGPNNDAAGPSNPTITSISLNNSSYSINQGATAAITVTAFNSDGSSTDVTSSTAFTSSNPASVTINSRGVMTGVSLGSSTITASYRTYSATAAATVAAPLTITRIAFDYSTYNININAYRTITLNAYMADGSYQNVTSAASYTSFSSSIASINAYGSLYGYSAGTATISASYNGFSTSSTVVVSSLINSISADVSAFNVSVGSNHSMVITAHESSGTTSNVTTSATYFSSNPSVATVNLYGVTGVSSGSSTITVTYGGFTAYIYVTVENSRIPTWGSNASLVATGITQTSALLTWTGALDDVGVTGYRIYQNSNLLTTLSNVTSFLIDNLSAGQGYSFKVEAGDALQSWSTTGPSVYVNTLPQTDLAAPTPTPTQMSAYTTNEIPLNISTVREKTKDGEMLSRVQIVAAAFNKVLNDADANTNTLSTITIKLDDYKDTIVIEFPERAFNTISTISPGLSMLIQAGTTSVRLPVALLKKYAPTENGKLVFSIHNLTGDEASNAKQLLKQIKANILLPNSLQFTLSANGVEVPSYEGIYLESTIAITTENSLILANSTAIWLNLKTGKTGFVPTTFTTDNNLTTFKIKAPHGGIFNIVTMDKHFTDLSQHWAKNELEALASKLIINGVSNTVFAPEQEISRAQFAALLIRSLGLDGDGAVNTKSKFKDVKSSDWFASEVQIASSKGLIDGYEDGSFKPLASITREQMATMIYRAQKLVDPTSNPINLDSVLTKYTDQEKVGSWARTSLAATLQDGLIQGVTETNLAPQSNATRAQAGVMLKRLLQNIKFIN